MRHNSQPHVDTHDESQAVPPCVRSRFSLHHHTSFSCCFASCCSSYCYSAVYAVLPSSPCPSLFLCLFLLVSWLQLRGLSARPKLSKRHPTLPLSSPLTLPNTWMRKLHFSSDMKTATKIAKKRIHRPCHRCSPRSSALASVSLELLAGGPVSWLSLSFVWS